MNKKIKEINQRKILSENERKLTIKLRKTTQSILISAR